MLERYRGRVALPCIYQFTESVASIQGATARELVARCQALAPTLIVLEATGGYEATVVAALATAGLPVVANPRQVRDFAKAMGQLAKTDARDAQVQALDALLTRRRQLVAMLTAERNRLLLARPAVRRDLQQHIGFLERRLREADTGLHTAVQASPLWRVKDDLLQSVPGVGRVVSSPSSPSYLSLGGALPRKSRRWSASRRSIGTAGPCAASAWSTVAGHPCARRSTWLPSSPANATR